MNIKGYVNPRELGNEEPNQFLGMDIFVEQLLWDKHIAGKHEKVRTWDVVWMMRMHCSSVAIQHGKAEFPVYLGRRKMSLRAYLHPRMMALCVGLPDATSRQK